MDVRSHLMHWRAVAAFDNAPGKGCRDAEPAFDLTQHENAAVRWHLPAIEAGNDQIDAIGDSLSIGRVDLFLAGRAPINRLCYIRDRRAFLFEAYNKISRRLGLRGNNDVAV